MEYGYGQLNGYQIEYNGINIHDHYQEGGTFIAVKLLQKAILEYSQTGKVIYSNDHLIGCFGVTRRGLQTAMTILEQEGIMKRTFLDPVTKRHRTGFTLDINMAIDWLGTTNRSEAYHQAPKRSLFRAFVNQAVINIKSFARDLKKAMRITKNKQDRLMREEKIAELNRKQQEYDAYISYQIKRRQRMMKQEKETHTPEEVIETLTSWITTLGYKPPKVAKN